MVVVVVVMKGCVAFESIFAKDSLSEGKQRERDRVVRILTKVESRRGSFGVCIVKQSGGCGPKSASVVHTQDSGDRASCTGRRWCGDTRDEVPQKRVVSGAAQRLASM